MLKVTAWFLVAVMMGNSAFAQTGKTKKSKHEIVKAVPKDTAVVVGGATMSPVDNIVQNASKSNDHTTLVSAVNAAGLTSTLAEAGPFTVFAPTNEAFDIAGKIAVDSLLANTTVLTQVLNYNVVAGKYDSKALVDLMIQGNGKAQLKTIEGGILIAEKKGDRIMLTDELGTKAFVTIKDVYQSNGVIHVVDRVLMPNLNASVGKL